MSLLRLPRRRHLRVCGRGHEQAPKATIDNNRVFGAGVDGAFDIGIGNYGLNNVVTNNKVRGYSVPYDGVTSGKNKADDPRFQRGVALLASRGLTTDELLDFTRHGDRVGYCMALEALVTRHDGVDASAAILERLTTAPGTTRACAR